MRRQALLALGILGSVIAVAQAPPAFDVVSIKPNATPAGGREDGGGSLRFTPGSVAGRKVSARRIILEAYHLTDRQLSGGPSWLDSDRFDIEGKAAAPADENQLRVMLQSLLAQRFKLVVRHETKEMAVYALQVAKSGPALQEIKPGEPAPSPLLRHKVEGTLAGSWMDRGSMQHFTDALSRNPLIDRPVLDKTGLQGSYLIFMQWGADDNFMAAVEEQFG